MIAGGHYRGHDSAASSEYLAEMDAQLGGATAKAIAADPLAKVHALAAQVDEFANDMHRRLDMLEAAARLSSQRGRPEHMSPGEWLERAK
jgi:hypothetical protein